MSLDDESFAGAPQTVGEIRSDKSKSARDWTPRDVLVSLLREIDRGEVVPTDLVLFFREDPLPGSGAARTQFRNASRDNQVSMGLVEDGKLRMFQARFE